MEKKREDIRIDDELEVTIQTVFEPTGAMVKAIYNIPMIVSNISASGLLLETERDFEMGTSFKFELPIEEKIVDVIVVIVRKQLNEKTQKYIYGCKFEHLELISEQTIRRYVFNKELAKRRRSERKY